MARWKLTEPHYLNVPGEKWEFQSTDRMTGRPIRKQFQVPRHLDPRVDADWNYKNGDMDGEIIVAYAGKGLAQDIIFEGDPTPGMLPLDAEAEEISSRFTWTPTASTSEEDQSNSFTNQLLNGLIEKIGEASVAAQNAPQAPGVDKFMEAMTAMMAQQTQILAQLANPLRQVQVVDNEPPLEDAEPTEAELAEATKAAIQAEKASAVKAQDHVARRRI